MADCLGYALIFLAFFLAWATGSESVEAKPLEALKEVSATKVRAMVKKPVKAHQAVKAKLLGVVDGDTLHVELKGEKKSIRIGYIDCPESNFFHKKQRFGDEAKENLVKLCAKHIGKPVELTILSLDPRRGRINGLIKVGGVDVSTHQVETGWAWVYPQFNKNPELPLLQEVAKKHRIGLWRDRSPTPPWEWRKANK